jgi:cytohesin
MRSKGKWAISAVTVLTVAAILTWGVTRGPDYESLSHAAHQGDLEAVRAFLDDGVQVDERGRFERTPLQSAVLGHHWEVAVFLLDHGASPDASMRDAPYRTLLQCVASNDCGGFDTQAERLRWVELLIDRGADLELLTGRSDRALHIAAESGHAPIVEMLLEAGADPRPLEDESPLYRAVARSHADVVDVLLAHGVRPRRECLSPPPMVHHVLYDGNRELLDRLHQAVTEPPLHRAAARGDVAAVRQLVADGAAFDEANDLCELPIHRAAEEGRGDAIQALVEAGADVDAMVFGWTALEIAARFGDRPLVEQLDGLGADLRNGAALAHASRAGHLEVARYLLDRGVDPNPQRGAYCPLHSAVLRGHDDVIRLLLERGADANGCGSQIPARFALDDLSLLELLVEHGADLSVVDDLGETLLHRAARSGDIEVVAYLLEHGLDPDAVNSIGVTPQDLAARNGRDAVVDLLTAAK